MMETLQTLLVGADKIFLVCAAGLAFEYLRPTEKEQPAAAIVFNMIWIVNFVIMTNLVMLVVGRLVPLGIGALGGPLVTIDFPPGILGGVAQFTLLLVIHDFFYYWFHRCQHTWGWFWAHHKMHHTEIHLNASTSFRHHWMENVYRIPFIFIPMGLFNFNGTYTLLIFDLALAWAVFTHLNMRVSMGPLTGWLAGPQYHRIHHSALPQHQNRNFTAFFPIWDRVFGTYCEPARNEFPPCGMADGEVTGSLWQAHTGVFRDWYAMWKRRMEAGKRAAPAVTAAEGG